MQVLIKISLFPLLMALAVLLPALVYTGRLPLPMQGAMMMVFFSSILLVALLERWMPYQQKWQQGAKGELKVDATSMGMLMMVLDPLISKASPLLAVMLLAALGLPQSSWLNLDSYWLQLLLVLFGAEFGQYWLHRFAHQQNWLWKVHKQHHSVQRIYWLNGFRAHPLNMLWHHFAGVFVMRLLGIQDEVLMAYATIAAVSQVFQHANIELKLGFLNRIFSTNQLHRWHHSLILAEANNNYGAVLVVWDWLFGTYYNPVNRHVAGLGLANDASYPLQSYWLQVRYPFAKQATKQTASI